jgi:hypothetical protein
MTRDITLTPAEKLFESMRTVILMTEAFCICIAAIRDGDIPGADNRLRYTAREFGLEVLTPMGAIMRNLVRGEETGTLTLTIKALEADPPATNRVNVFPRALTGLVTPVYVDFFERYRPWIRANCGGDSYAWPPILNFARAVRNWISHHHGRVHFDNPAAAPVVWGHLSYGPPDAGKLVVGADLDPGGMVLLMIEIADELDRLGCPLDP